MDNEISLNGWTAVPVDAGKIFSSGPYIHKPETLLVDDIAFPSGPLVAEVQRYAKQHLSTQAYNHSMRVFYFGMAIVQQQFPERASTFSASTLALTCLLHDMGATKNNMSLTRMSFEFYGAVKALVILKGFGCHKDQAEAVCETIIRHQDLGTEGNITFLGQIVQLATIYDNVGKHPAIKDYAQIVHENTRKDVNQAFPRDGWLRCFADILREEERLKPWCHTTHIPEFDKQIESNELMKPYE